MWKNSSEKKDSMSMIYNFLNFPLPSNNGKPLVELSPIQLDALDNIRTKIHNGEYKLIETSCLCGSNGREYESIVTTEDRYGLPFKLVICRNCGLLRTNPRLDEDSLLHFYSNYFSLLHRGNKEPTQKYLNYVVPTGIALHEFISRHVNLNNIKTVLEIGCATGSNLLPFDKETKVVSGYDYDEGYLQYGIDLGLNLHKGDYSEQVIEGTQDLIILSHVLEHMSNPVQELQKIVIKVKPLGYLYIEVPGVFFIDKRWKHCPTIYFQNDHLFHFYKQYLDMFFKALRLDVLYSDQYCRCIVQRPEYWASVTIENLFVPEPVVDLEFLKRYLKSTFVRYKFRTNLIGMLDRLGVKNIVITGYRRIRYKKTTTKK